jgi:hypothetical protein
VVNPKLPRELWDCVAGGPYSGYENVNGGYDMESTSTKYVIVEDRYPYEGGRGYTGPFCKEAGIEPGKLYDTLSDAGANVRKLQRIGRISLTVRIYREAKLD